MSRFILLVIVVLAAYVVIKALARVRRRSEPKQDLPERMVSCRQCGVNVPMSEALEYDGSYFCSEAHRPGDAK